MISGKYKAEKLRVGLRVGAVCGPGERPEDCQGWVTNRVETRWGVHWLVTMDDGTAESISCDVTNEMGIGWYALAEAA